MKDTKTCYVYVYTYPCIHAAGRVKLCAVLSRIHLIFRVQLLGRVVCSGRGVDGKYLRLAARCRHAGNKPGDPMNGNGGVNDISISISISICSIAAEKNLRLAARRPHAGNKPGDPVNGQGGVNDIPISTIPTYLY